MEDPSKPEHMPTFEDPSKPEHIPRNTPEEVQWFRDAIDYRFTRFQVFYDLLNDQMTRYRMAHVASVTSITTDMMTVFGENLQYVRQSTSWVNEVIQVILDQLGGIPNACLEDTISCLENNSINLGRDFNVCARRTNNTIARGLDEVFYPTFVNIQDSASSVPLLVMDALSRGNVFDDPQAIIDYLDSQYEVVTLQWLGAASQLFRWETNRWEIEGGYYTDEMIDCLVDPVTYFAESNSLLMFYAWDNCRT